MDALSDEQVKTLVDTVKGLPPYVFVMLGLYAGLRREESLALQWDCVFLDSRPHIFLSGGHGEETIGKSRRFLPY